jgi:hypothetical protein
MDVSQPYRPPRPVIGTASFPKNNENNKTITIIMTQLILILSNRYKLQDVAGRETEKS